MVVSSETPRISAIRVSGKQSGCCSSWLTWEVLGVLVVDKGGEVTSVIEDHVEGLALWEGSEGLVDTPDVLLLGLTLPGVDGDTGSGDSGSGVVLGGEDVTRRPGDLGTESGKGLDQDSGLDGPVDRSSQLWVSMRTDTAYMWRQPAIRAPLRGCSLAYFSRRYMRPGISRSASSISFRPKAAREMSATLY